MAVSPIDCCNAQPANMNHKEELSNFWKWAEMSPDEYASDRGSGEWEADYPNWRLLDTAADDIIESLNSEYSADAADLLIQILAIDNDSESTLDKIQSRLIPQGIFADAVVKSHQPQAKRQIAELLGTIDIPGRCELLITLICDENDTYVKRRALLSLNRVNVAESKRQAAKFTSAADSYLRTVSEQILNGGIEPSSY